MASNPYANLVKMLNAITLLSQPSGTTINSLMEKLGVSRRTVFRLLQALDELGFPVTNDRTNFGGEKTYRLIETYVQRLSNISLPGVVFTPREAFYIQALLKQAHPMPDDESEPILTPLQNKLDNILREAERALTEPTGTSAGAPHSDKDRGRLVESIRLAIRDHRECAIRFRNFEPPGSRLYVIHPVRLIQESGAFYLFAGLPRHEGIRLLPVDRFASIEILENTFTSIKDEELDSLVARSFDLSGTVPINVVVRFAAGYAPSIRNLHFGYFRKAVANADGSSTMTITTTATDALMQYVLALGDRAEILSPPSLRQAAENRLATWLAQYRSSGRS